jgi:N-acetylglucosamine-6-sulfatase
MTLRPGKVLSMLLCTLALATLLVPYQNSMFLTKSSNVASAALSFKPNIVVIMADDLDQRSLDLLIQEGLMPNLKRHIIDKGVTFSDSIATYPLCCPSRATFLTGQYPHNHDVWNNAPPFGGVAKLNDSSTLATWLQDSGYHTDYVGKYLNRYGIDTELTYIPPGWNDWQATTGSSTYWMFGYTFNDNGVLVKYGNKWSEYQTDIVAKRSVEVINERESSDATPFFLYINPLAPHEDGRTTACELNYGDIKSTRPAPRHIGTTAGLNFLELMPPSFNEEDVNDKPWRLRYPELNSTHIACLDDLFHARLESMRAVDDLIGKVTTALVSNNELWKTVFVFTSDNGFLLGEHRFHGKQKVYEESIKLPLYMRIPQVAPQTIDKLVINNDLAPTFLEFARAEAGIEIDGRSLVPLINDPSISWRNGVLIEDLLYTAIRTEDYVYAIQGSGFKEIYDLNNDPYQLENAASTEPWKSKIPALEDWRAALEACTGMTCQTAENRAAP